MKYLFFTMILLSCGYLLLILFSRYIYDTRGTDVNSFSKEIMSALKGFAITIIMTAHIANLFGVRYLNPLGAWGVAIFLFCSGYGLEKSAKIKGLKGFWKKRIKKVYLLYFIIEIFAFIFIYDNITGLEIVLDLSLISTRHPFGWYMQCLFMYYIAFYVGHIFRNNKIKYFIIILLSIFLFIFGDGLFKQQILSFLLGVLIADKSSIEKRLQNNSIVFVTSILMAVLLLVLKQIPVLRMSNEFIYRFIEALDTVFMLFMSIELFNILAKRCVIFIIPFIIIGNISYEIYLVHGFFMPTEVSILSILRFYFLTFLTATLINQRKAINRIWKYFRRGKNENKINPEKD